MFGDSKFKQNAEASSPVPINSDFSLSPSIKNQPQRSENSLRPVEDIRTNGEFDNSVTSIVSALLSAVLALVVLMLVIFTIQAIKRRRRERQGTLLNQPVIHAIATPAFASTTAAYTSRSGLTPSRYLTWENVAHSSARVIHPVDREESLAEDHDQRQMSNPVEVSTTNSDLSASTASSSASASSSSNRLSSSQSFSCL